MSVQDTTPKLSRMVSRIGRLLLTVATKTESIVQSFSSRIPRNIVIWAAVLIPVGIATALTLAVAQSEIAVLSPAGEIAERQRELLVFAVALSAFVIVPVFIMTILFSIRYRAGNKHATYHPEWGHNSKLEATWWGIPIVIILVLSAVTWRTSHTLDPYKPLDRAAEPIRIQAIALQWRWLFLYPDYNIATINHIQVPVGTPINFEISADAPMNSLWIPKLGTMLYAMNGMTSRLHLVADQPGTYQGVSSNISGEGFAAMRFVVNADTQRAFTDWVMQAKASSLYMSDFQYDMISLPSHETTQETYSGFDVGLYDRVIEKYMPAGHRAGTHGGGH